ncbi:MAG TPA: dihydroneopterin aldolase [Frankiaceae bacterium]
MNDRIRLAGLRVRGTHGVYEHERRDGQDFVVDVTLELDLRRAATSDDVADTVHYGELAQALAAVVAGPPVDLLETLATRLAAVCLADARVRAAEVTVHKPQAPIPLDFADVAVTLRRGRRVVLALGSNVGDRLGHLRAALEGMAPLGIEPRAVSPVVETPFLGGEGAGDVLNAVVVAESALDGPALLAACRRLEADRDRQRAVRWGDRTLDVDVVAVGPLGGELASADPLLTLPHPAAQDRWFVVAPWAAVEPAATLPVDGRPVPVVDLAARLATVQPGGVRRDDLLLGPAPGLPGT